MKLFISYARVDFTLVVEIVEILRVGGHDPWFDHRLLPGQNWKHELHNAIANCEAFVYMLTPESIASEWCQWEFAEAVKLGKPIVPILLRPCEMPGAIRAFQYCDFSRGITVHNVAQLYGGLTVIIANQPYIEVPSAPKDPKGIPAQAAEVEIEELAPPDPSIFPGPFEWCEIPEGVVTLTDKGGYLKEPQTFKVDRFWIAKYPITNAQYWLFTNARDGYADPKWWDYSRGARQWRQASPIPSETVFDGNELPRTNITWYEAVSFCRWMNANLNGGEKVRKIEIRLSTEQEWQRAAQADGDFKYPWGMDFDNTLANTSESHRGKVVSVTSFPSGSSTFGVLQMSGNVWEWCLTNWDTGTNSLSSRGRYVLRGGAWDSDYLCAQVVYRNANLPLYGFGHTGFRVIAASLRSGL